MSSSDRIRLDLDRRTAELLFAALYNLGEHEADGAPIPRSTQEGAEKLGELLRDLTSSSEAPVASPE